MSLTLSSVGFLVCSISSILFQSSNFYSWFNFFISWVTTLVMIILQFHPQIRKFSNQSLPT